MRLALCLSLALLAGCPKAEDPVDTDPPTPVCEAHSHEWTPNPFEPESFTLEVGEDWSVVRATCQYEDDSLTLPPCEEGWELIHEDVSELFYRSDDGQLCYLDPEECDLGAATSGWQYWTVTALWEVCG